MTIGIYRITCVPTGRVYIGSSVCIEKRFDGHRKMLLAGKHHSVDFQKAWDIHGEGNFTFAIIEARPSRDGLRLREQELIILHDSVRNGLNRTYETEFTYVPRVVAKPIAKTPKCNEKAKKRRKAKAGSRYKKKMAAIAAKKKFGVAKFVMGKPCIIRA